MCGILGGLSLDPLPWLNESGRLDAAIDSLKHRGPDDRGRFVFADRRGFLGHRRLSIIDLPGGQQPIEDETGRTHLCYNGEIYNFRELRRELEGRGHAFRTKTDGETALHLYQESGGNFAERLSGMFAIAILDEDRRRLTLVRDRNGIKPLYYHLDGRLLLFASELKAILALLPQRPPISAEGLRAYLRWKYIPDPLTIYENIYKLEPGHRLTVSIPPTDDQLHVENVAYWDLDYGGDLMTDEAEAVFQLDARLRAAVESHLESDVEVGALLSGGVDSSLVVAIAAQLSGRRIKTFSVGFEEMGFDQLPFARTLAEQYDTDHHEEYVRLNPMQTAEKLAGHFDEPFADSSALASFRVCEVAARHVKVVLTGDGGDESFAGYRRYQDVAEAASGRSGLRRIANRASVATSSALFSPEAKFLKHPRLALLSPLEQHLERQALCSVWLTDLLLGCRHSETADGSALFERLRSHGAARDWSPTAIAQYVDMRLYLPGDILTKVDRTSMACSLECRVPLLDHTITEFSAHLADNLKVCGNVRKYLLKRVAERYVPHELLYRPKMGFRVPVRRWFKRELLGQTADLLRDGALVGHGLLDRAGLQWVFRQQRHPWIDLASPLWALLCLEYWARGHFTAG